MKIRLQKIISDAGVASRRNAEVLILDGKVKVNGKQVKTLGFKADPDKDKVAVEGNIIKIKRRKIYVALNKPIGVITSRSDEKGRETVVDCVPIDEYLYPIGRLDIDSTGLILLTNDGEVTNAVLHPKHEIEKTYVVKVDGFVDNSKIEKFKSGIRLEEGMTAPAKAEVMYRGRDYTKLEVVITEGKNRQIRRMFDALGHKVNALKRTKIGIISLGDLPYGKHRRLDKAEIDWLKSLVNTDKS